MHLFCNLADIVLKRANTRFKYNDWCVCVCVYNGDFKNGQLNNGTIKIADLILPGSPLINPLFEYRTK